MELLLDNYLKFNTLVKLSYLIALIAGLYIDIGEIQDHLSHGSKISADLYLFLLFVPIFGATQIRSGNKLNLFIIVLTIFGRVLSKYEAMKDEDNEDNMESKLEIIKLLSILLVNTYLLFNVIPGTSDVQVPSNMQLLCFFLAAGNLGFSIKEAKDHFNL